MTDQVPSGEPGIAPSNVPGIAPTNIPNPAEHPATPEQVAQEVAGAQQLARQAVSKPDAPDQVSPEEAREMQAEDEAKHSGVNPPPAEEDEKPKAKKKGKS